MPKLVGLNCTVCGECISSTLDAEFCMDCKNPVHHDCKRLAHEANDYCALCGAPRGRSDLHAEVPGTTPDDALSNSPRPLSHLFSFTGRATRSTYFVHTFLDGFAILALVICIDILIRPLGQVGEILATVSILGVFAVCMWSEIAVTVRRLHDLDRPGSHWFLMIVPIYNIYLNLVLLLKAGTVGPNNYGEDLVGSEYSEVENLLVAASRLEMSGDWNRAFALYQEAYEKLAGQPDEEYAINCIKRLQEKIILAQTPDSS